MIGSIIFDLDGPLVDRWVICPEILAVHIPIARRTYRAPCLA